jgi:hypothetical protein
LAEETWLVQAFVEVCLNQIPMLD